MINNVLEETILKENWHSSGEPKIQNSITLSYWCFKLHPFKDNMQTQIITLIN